MATHSPVLAAVPDATLLELTASGLRRRSWDELEVVEHHRRFLSQPGSYLRHLD